MLNLIRANFTRLIKGKTFYICLIIMGFLGYASAPDKDNFFNNAAESNLLNFITFSCFTGAVLIARFLGTDYSDGTIRNKITLGRTRSSIYVSNFILCLSANLIQCMVYIVFYLIGAAVSGVDYETKASRIILFILCCLLLMTVWTSLYTFIGMLCSSKAGATTACVMISVALFIFALYLTISLSTMEMYEKSGLADDFVFFSETKKKIYEFLMEFTPGGQAMTISNFNTENLIRPVIYDVILSVGFTGAGLFLFEKKNLK